MKYIKPLSRSFAAHVRNAERGDAATFEFVVWVAPMVTMIFLIGVVVIYWASRLPVRAAATDCVRAAITTLERRVGIDQGEKAGWLSLEGNNINAKRENVSVVVTTENGGWSRGDRATCTVRLKINLGDSSTTPAAPSGSFEELLNSPTASINPAGLEIVEAVTMKIEPLKSNWKE